MLIGVPKVGTWDVLHQHWRKYWSTNGFALNA